MEKERNYSEKDKKRFEVMNLLTSRVITEEEAGGELGVSARQIRRLKKRFLREGKTIDSLVYHRTHEQANKVPDTIRDKIIVLRQEGLHRSCQHIAELLPVRLSKGEKQWCVRWKKRHYRFSPQTIKNILEEAGLYEPVYEKTEPATRFEMEHFGELVQMDTTSYKNLCGYKKVYLILNLDDYSRRILAGLFCLSDSVYNNMTVLRQTIEKYGIFKMVYTDNASLFTYIRHKDYSWKVYGGQMRYYQNKTQPEMINTEIEQALLELRIPLLSHYPGHPRAKGKIERMFQFIERRFIEEVRNRVTRLEQLNTLFHTWISWYNHQWVNRDTKCTPEEKTTPSLFKPLPEGTNLDDIFCVKDFRKVDKTNSFSYEGKTYTLNYRYNAVACTVELHIHPGKKIRVFHQGEFIEELPYQKQDILSFKQ